MFTMLIEVTNIESQILKKHCAKFGLDAFGFAEAEHTRFHIYKQRSLDGDPDDRRLAIVRVDKTDWKFTCRDGEEGTLVVPFLHASYENYHFNIGDPDFFQKLDDVLAIIAKAPKEI